MVKIGRLKQIREMMKTKKSLSKESVVGQALDGQIQITVDGTQSIVDFVISEEILSSNNKDRIEKGVKDAHHDAQKQLQKIMVEKMKSGDLQLPDLQG